MFTYSFDLLSTAMSSFITLVVVFSRLAYTMFSSSEPNGLVLLHPQAAYRKTERSPNAADG